MRGRASKATYEAKSGRRKPGVNFIGSCGDGRDRVQVVCVREQGGYRADIHLKPTPKWYKFPGTSGLCKGQAKQLQLSKSPCLAESQELAEGDGNTAVLRIISSILDCEYIYLSVSAELSSIYCSHYCLLRGGVMDACLNLQVSIPSLSQYCCRIKVVAKALGIHHTGEERLGLSRVVR